MTVFGPVGLKDYILNSIKSSESYLVYELEVIEIQEKETKLPFPDWVSITAFPIEHKVPCFGYVFQEKSKPGRLDAVKCKELGVEPKQNSILASGKDVTTKDGKLVKSSDVVGPSRIGKKIVLLGDTCNADSILEYGQNCNVLVHEASFDENCEDKAMQGKHSTSKMAGLFASKINAKLLILTHFSSRYSDKKAEITTNQLCVEASKYCKCKVLPAEDLMKIKVPENEEEKILVTKTEIQQDFVSKETPL